MNLLKKFLLPVRQFPIEKIEETKPNTEPLKLLSKLFVVSANTLLHIEGLPSIKDLNVLSGSFINLEYQLLNGNPELVVYKKK